MHMWCLPVLTVVAAGLGVFGAARAQGLVSVQLSPAVQARATELGRDELASEQRYLEHAVRQALARRPRPPVSVSLTIEDIQPNRPTSAQLGARASLSRAGSAGLGGAAITGELVDAAGARHPVRYRFFPQNLADETDFTPWGDADQAFDELAHDIGAGHPPDDERSWPPSGAPGVPTGTRLPG